LQRAGKVKVTYLSARRKGVREDHDLEYLATTGEQWAEYERQLAEDYAQKQKQKQKQEGER
jgi:hypothetical protein